MVSHKKPEPTARVLQVDGSEVRARRKALGLSREELAVMSRMSMATVGRVETGAHEPTVTKLRALADALGCTIDDLLYPTAESA